MWDEFISRPAAWKWGWLGESTTLTIRPRHCTPNTPYHIEYDRPVAPFDTMRGVGSRDSDSSQHFFCACFCAAFGAKGHGSTRNPPPSTLNPEL